MKSTSISPRKQCHDSGTWIARASVKADFSFFAESLESLGQLCVLLNHAEIEVEFSHCKFLLRDIPVRYVLYHRVSVEAHDIVVREVGDRIIVEGFREHDGGAVRPPSELQDELVELVQVVLPDALVLDLDAERQLIADPAIDIACSADTARPGAYLVWSEGHVWTIRSIISICQGLQYHSAWFTGGLLKVEDDMCEGPDLASSFASFWNRDLEYAIPEQFHELGAARWGQLAYLLEDVAVLNP